MLQCAYIFKANCYLQVHNVNLKLTSPGMYPEIMYSTKIRILLYFFVLRGGDSIKVKVLPLTYIFCMIAK